MNFQALYFGRRIKAAGIHLFISMCITVFFSGLAFAVWYPGFYRLLAGGNGLFLLVVSVDVILGPLLTFAVFNLKKELSHLRRDLIVIGVIQFAALVYGLYTVYQARPIALVFEVDRFKVLTQAQVHMPELSKALPEYKKLPINGPWLLGTRKPHNTETNDVLFMAIENGIDRAQRPQFWVPYENSLPEVLARAKPISLLFSQYPERVFDLKNKLKENNSNVANMKFLPVIGREGDWVVILDERGTLLQFMQLSGFF